MSEPLPETPVLPQGPVSPDAEGLYQYAGGLNRMLHDQLADLIRKANNGDLTDGGVIVGDLAITGDLIVTGDGSFSGALTVADEAYDDAGWNGDLSVPTKNAIRDIWETLGTAAFEDIGTSGTTVPLLDTANTWSATQTLQRATDGEELLLVRELTGNNAASIRWMRARTGPTAVQANDRLAEFGAWGFDGTDYDTSQLDVVIRMFAAENFSSTAHGTYVQMSTITPTTLTRVDRMRIAQGVFHPGLSDMGNDSLNFTNIYRAGNFVPGPASQAEGDILYRGASDWLRLAKGTSGQVLAQNSGLTAPEWVSPDLEFVGTVTASTSAQLLVDSSTTGALAANYDYIIEFDQLQPSADGYLTMQYGTGGTPTYQNTGYQTHVTTGSSAERNTITTAIHVLFAGTAGGLTAGETISGELTVQNPGGNQIHTSFGTIKNTANAGEIRNNIHVGHRTTAEVVTGLRFAMNTGNINSGTIRVYRRRIT